MKDIHVRYEDDFTKPGLTMSAGATLHSLEVKVCTVVEGLPWELLDALDRACCSCGAVCAHRSVEDASVFLSHTSI